ncbi:mitochondrial import receptor subunit OR translocase-domain-containing protein [Fusarium solani]|uniref:Mitochondrial import receptor subunit OR translocase-domain-containing protein n=1 Tax=Fusarium solani TaxID=169388 RepID=A0A9P9RDL1_FUSSL|nr:mitochondrial import receptor subunit OR translocase-domain-containing protein [Fusarium solani]KAH7275691.1 mitochondrial import receptor subunit OR translocase-domain-containing protein [Fusarium solani]
MFGGFAPPQQSQEEIRALEAEATFTIQQAVATAVLLYLCMTSPALQISHSKSLIVSQPPSPLTSAARSFKPRPSPRTNRKKT